MTNPPAPATVSALPAKLRSFLLEAGAKDSTPVISLKDGGNNQVYRIPAGTQDYVLKRYFQDAADPRDRFNTERNFYELLWNSGIRQIPEPCVWDLENRLGLFAFVPGRKLTPGEITGDTVSQAARFIIDINAIRPQPTAAKIAPASEARFSIAEQSEGIAGRVNALQQITGESEMDLKALAFVRDELRPAWEKTAVAIKKQCATRTELDTTIDPAQRCLSPSDFGFHNALHADGAPLRFFDFEYAGWDDPAKLVCDFFCQPQVPVDFEHWDSFIGALAVGLGDKTSLPERAKILLPAYQIKWCCIILNHFVTTGKARRAFAHGAASEDAKSAQLEKARRLLGHLRTGE